MDGNDCIYIVWQVAACQDLEGLVYCHDKHQTALFLFLWQRGRVIQYVCVTVGWLDIHVALIIVPLSFSSHSGIGQALMWVWSHVTLGCWVEVAYWYRHHIVNHISYRGRLFEMKATLCLSCSVAVWIGTESRLCERCCSGTSWSPGNLVSECKCVWKYKIHAWRVRVVGLDIRSYTHIHSCLCIPRCTYLISFIYS